MNLESLKADLRPASGGHLMRNIVGLILVGGGVAGLLMHYVFARGEWNKYELAAVLGVVLAGLLIMFTKTIMDVIDKIPVPWHRG